MSKRLELLDLIASAEKANNSNVDWNQASFLAAALDIVTRGTNTFRSDAEEMISICCPEYWDNKGKEVEVIQDYLIERE